MLVQYNYQYGDTDWFKNNFYFIRNIWHSKTQYAFILLSHEKTWKQEMNT